MTTTKREPNPARHALESTHSPTVQNTAGEPALHATSGDATARHMIAAPHNNLSLPRTPLIGRDRTVAAVQHLLLQEQVGLLTLTGPGGMGKTRLALQVAANVLDHFVDGVYFVALAPISDPALVSTAIAQALGVSEAPDRSVQESLQAYLHDKQLLLVLDNFEQILPAAPLVSALLNACRRLKVLATSRSTLHLYGEQEFSVPPLALPDLRRFTTLEKDAATGLTEFAAIDLFCQRANAVKPDFALTAINAADVAKICIGLDGLPLAIELAAARIKLFTPSALLARLNQSLTLLTGGPHDLPTRQRTLRDEIAWSYDLLSAEEQTLFRRLAVFVGGFTLAAAQAVSNPSIASGQVLGVDVLEGVATLVDQNLLKPMAQSDGETRFGMLETIHEYGLEQLTASGEVEAIRHQHLNFYLALAEEADPKLRGAEQLVWLQRLDSDYANLQSALAWSLRDESQVDDHDRWQGLHLAGTLSWFWYLRARFNEGRGWCERAVALSETIDGKATRARVLQGAGIMAQMQGDFAQARVWLEESLALWQKLEDDCGIAFTLMWLAWAAGVPGDSATARLLAERSLAIFRKIGDSWGIAWALDTLGSVGGIADFAIIRSLLEESVVRFRQIRDAWGMVDALSSLGDKAYRHGDYRMARQWLAETLALGQPLGEKFSCMVALITLGAIARLQGENELATTYFTQNLALAREVGNQSYVACACQQLGLLAQQQGDDTQAMAYLRTSLELAWAAMGQTENLVSLIGCIAVAAHQQQWEHAARLAGAVETLRTNLDGPFTPLQEADYERSFIAVRARRSEPLVAAAWARGRTMTLEEAIAYALTLPDVPISIPSTVASTPMLPLTQTYPAGLTAREVEVLRLLAQRFTYPEIAEKLIISRRTVNAHVTSIYSKLGVTTREGAIRFTAEHHLV